MNRLSSLSLVGTALALTGAMLFIRFNPGGDGTRVFAAPPPIPLDLSEVTPNWDKNLPSASRFTVLAAFNNQAVRDNNTGLVWEQAPSGTQRFWGDAAADCVSKNVGGTVGWRLPSVVELRSVQDPTLGAPFVPASAFTISTSATTPGVQLAYYWSTTTNTFGPTEAWIVGFGTGFVGVKEKGLTAQFWCVRGGMNADAY